MYTLAILSPNHALIEEQTLADWDISNVQIRLQNAAPGTMTFELNVTRYEEDHPFTWRRGLSLRKDGQQVFLGYVTSSPAYASGAAESVQVTAQDAMYYLARFAMDFDWSIEDGVKIGDYQVQPEIQTKITMQQGIIFVQKVRNQDERYSTLDLWNQIGAACGHKGIPIQWGSAKIPEYSPPPQKSTNQSILDILRFLLRWHPDSIISLDYSTTPATINMHSASDNHAVNRYTVGFLDGDIQIADLRDNIPTGIVITYKDAKIGKLTPAPEPGLDGVIDLSPYYTQKWPDNISITDMDVIMETVEWKGIKLPDENVAKIVYDALTKLGWSIHVTLTNEECSISKHLGKLLNVSGGKQEWSRMDALIQDVSYSIDDGVTTIQASPVPPWSIGDFIDLFFRPKNYGDQGGMFGFGKSDEEEEDKIEDWLMWVCEINEEGEAIPVQKKFLVKKEEDE